MFTNQKKLHCQTALKIGTHDLSSYLSVTKGENQSTKQLLNQTFTPMGGRASSTQKHRIGPQGPKINLQETMNAQVQLQTEKGTHHEYYEGKQYQPIKSAKSQSALHPALFSSKTRQAQSILSKKSSSSAYSHKKRLSQTYVEDPTILSQGNYSQNIAYSLLAKPIIKSMQAFAKPKEPHQKLNKSTTVRRRSKSKDGAHHMIQQASSSAINITQDKERAFKALEDMLLQRTCSGGSILSGVKSVSAAHHKKSRVSNLTFKNPTETQKLIQGALSKNIGTTIKNNQIQGGKTLSQYYLDTKEQGKSKFSLKINDLAHPQTCKNKIKTQRAKIANQRINIKVWIFRQTIKLKQLVKLR